MAEQLNGADFISLVRISVPVIGHERPVAVVEGTILKGVPAGSIESMLRCGQCIEKPLFHGEIIDRGELKPNEFED